METSFRIGNMGEQYMPP